MRIAKWFEDYLERFDSRKEINSNKYRNGFSIKQIFLDYWDNFLLQKDVKNNGVRPCVLKEVDKMIHCGYFEKSFAIFECPNCHNFTLIAFSCKSRFCNNCSIIYAKNRANTITKKTLNVNHRHIVFTIDSDLRYYFKKDRSLLSCLFTVVEETLFSSLKACGRKSENLTPGIIMVLHTFGRYLKWNPHIHCLVTEGGMTDQNQYKSLNYINYERLRKALFDELAQHIDIFGSNDKFYQIKKQSYKNHDNGFYVYAPRQKNLSNKNNGQKQIINYVLRYTGRPVMAQSRIEAYNPITGIIQYWYQPHDSEEIVHVTENVMIFISKLIQHISEPNFKTIRYAGIYAAKDEKYREAKKRYTQNQAFQDFVHKFRNSIIQDFKRDPLLCTCKSYGIH